MGLVWCFVLLVFDLVIVVDFRFLVGCNAEFACFYLLVLTICLVDLIGVAVLILGLLI